MKTLMPILLLSAVFANAAVESSIKVPNEMHLKYTLGNQKNHPTIALEGKKQLLSLAKISKEDVKTALVKEGFCPSSIEIADVAKQLVFVVFAKDKDGVAYKLLLDAADAKILEKRRS